MSDIIIVLGTRPEIIKTYSIIKSLGKQAAVTIVWSGQHYDFELCELLFDQLSFPKPDYDLGVGSGTHASQTRNISLRLEKIIKETKPRIVLAQGDTNTVVGAALTAAKLRIPFAHVEAGMRSFDMTMPEEVNRLVVDRIAQMLFAPTMNAFLNLLSEGVLPSSVYFSGDTLVDAAIEFAQKISRNTKFLEQLPVEHGSYGLVTIHRAENTEDKRRLKNILEALNEIAEELPLIFPLHPRTKSYIEKYDLDGCLKKRNLIIINPVGYLEFLSLLKNSMLVITDSGGVQEEAIIFGVPCITARNNTEWIETLDAGGNFLTGASKTKIAKMAKYILEHNKQIKKKIANCRNLLGDGKAGERISKILIKELQQVKSPSLYSIDFRFHGYPVQALVLGKIFEGLSVSQVNERFSVSVTLIYDENGRPKVPFPDLTIKRNWKVKIWGPEKFVKRLYGHHISRNQL